PPVTLERRREQPPHVVAPAHVAVDVVRVAAGLADRAGDPTARVLVDVVEDHARALGGEAHGDAFAESRSAPGDDGHLVPQSHCISSFACGMRLPRYSTQPAAQSCRRATVLSVVKP